MNSRGKRKLLRGTVGAKMQSKKNEDKNAIEVQNRGKNAITLYMYKYMTFIHILILPPFQKECKSRFPKSQIISNLTKFIQNSINIYIITYISIFRL